MVVSVDALKAHLKIQYDDEDDLLESLSQQAQAAAEDFCRVEFDESAAKPVVLAITLMGSHYYENRENSEKQAYQSMRAAFESLLYPYRDPDQMF
jgi:uncharacterized phage protein (predicted DNA packaging)